MGTVDMLEFTYRENADQFMGHHIQVCSKRNADLSCPGPFSEVAYMRK